MENILFFDVKLYEYGQQTVQLRTINCDRMNDSCDIRVHTGRVKVS